MRWRSARSHSRSAAACSIWTFSAAAGAYAALFSDVFAGAAVMIGIDLFQFDVPLYGHDAALSASAIGLVPGMFAVAGSVTRALTPALIDRVGEELALIGSTVLVPPKA
jgi:hypothetical protein